MRVVAAQDITAHYAETLHHWRSRFEARRGELAALGYDDRFERLWELYLAYCEAGFRERRIGDVQVLLAKPRWRADAPAMTGRADALEAVWGRRERAVIATPASATAPPTAVIADGTSPSATQPTSAATG